MMEVCVYEMGGVATLTKDKVEDSKTEESYDGNQKPDLSCKKAPRKTHAEDVAFQHKVVAVTFTPLRFKHHHRLRP